MTGEDFGAGAVLVVALRLIVDRGVGCRDKKDLGDKGDKGDKGDRGDKEAILATSHSLSRLPDP